MNDIKEIVDLSGIIQTFENDMEFDAHGTVSKLGKSEAARELIEMGGEALPQIISHLETNPPDSKPGVPEGWSMVIHDILIRMGSYKVPETEVFKKPRTYEDLQSWIAWAKRTGGSND